MLLEHFSGVPPSIGYGSLQNFLRQSCGPVRSNSLKKPCATKISGPISLSIKSYHAITMAQGRASERREETFFKGGKSPTPPSSCNVFHPLFTASIYCVRFCGFWQFNPTWTWKIPTKPCTPWRINMEPENHLFEKEINENNLSDLHFWVPC